MNWKSKLKYIAIAWVVLTLLFIYLANSGLSKMYGGHTLKVDCDQFDVLQSKVTIVNVNILSPDGSSFITDQSVTIDNGLIVSIDSIGSSSSNIPTIDGQGKYLIPGLTDAHVHLFESPNDLLLYVANGVTQIRELIGSEDHLVWKKEIQQGRIGPDMYVASPRLGSFGLLEGWFMTWSQKFDNIRNASEAEKAVRKYQEMGYDGIKVYTQLNRDSYNAICKTAQSIDMPVMGHIPHSITMTDVYNSSQSEIAHFEEIMNALNREFGHYSWENAEEFLSFVRTRTIQIADSLILNNIVVTSTLWGTENLVRQKFDLDQLLKEVKLEYENPGILEWSTLVPRGGLGWLPHVNRHQLPEGLTEAETSGRREHWKTYVKVEQLVAKLLIEKKVKIMTGTDANLPMKVAGFSLHDEFGCLHRVGMSPVEILRSATVVPAEWMNNNTGKILEGMKANLVILDKNPLVDIENTKSINTVIVNGKVLNRKALDQILLAVKKANDASRKIDISQYLTDSSSL